MPSKLILLPTFLLAFITILSSCSTTVQITKRHYSPGYYVDISNKKVQTTNAVFEKQAGTIPMRSSSIEGLQSVPALAQQQRLAVPIVAVVQPAAKHQVTASTTRSTAKE